MLRKSCFVSPIFPKSGVQAEAEPAEVPKRTRRRSHFVPGSAAAAEVGVTVTVCGCLWYNFVFMVQTPNFCFLIVFGILLVQFYLFIAALCASV